MPRIVVSDDSGSIDLFDLFDAHMHGSSSSETIELKESKFEITHVKVRVTRNKPHTLGYCASGRLVREENITGRVAGLYRTITDGDGQFSYMAYLTSNYLDEKVSNERVYFNIAENTDGLFEESEISYHDIRTAVLPRVAGILGKQSHGGVVRRKGKGGIIRFNKGAEISTVCLVTWQPNGSLWTPTYLTKTWMRSCIEKPSKWSKKY